LAGAKKSLASNFHMDRVFTVTELLRRRQIFFKEYSRYTFKTNTTNSIHMKVAWYCKCAPFRHFSRQKKRGTAVPPKIVHVHEFGSVDRRLSMKIRFSSHACGHWIYSVVLTARIIRGFWRESAAACSSSLLIHRFSSFVTQSAAGCAWPCAGR
jgi:hypothetical protein